MGEPPPGCTGHDAPSIVCVPSSTGTYKVTVTVTDAAGQTATGASTLTVAPQSVASEPPFKNLATILGALGLAALITTIAAIWLTSGKTHGRAVQR